MWVNPFWFGFGIGFLAAIAVFVLFALLRGGDVDDESEDH